MDDTEAHEAPDTLTVRQAADRIGLSEHGMRNAIHRGDVPGVLRIGRCIRISRVAFDRWVRAVPGTAE